jgi:hypothetical protein
VTGRRSTAVVAQVLLVLSGPVVENAYTISKAEMPQAFVLLLSLVPLVAIKGGESRGRRIFLLAASAACVFLAGLTKETGPLLAPIAASWVVREGAFRRLGISTDGDAWRRRLLYLGATAVGAASLIAVYFLSGSMRYAGGAYPSGFDLSDLERLRSHAAIWFDWILRDYLYLGFLVLPALVIGVAGRRWREVGLQLDALLWMAAWVAVFVPWRFTQEYYLLPAALGAAVLGAVAFEVLIHNVRLPGRAWRAMAAAGLGLAGIAFVLTLPNNISNARVQLTVDRANAEFMAYAARNLPPDSVLLINIQDANEYTARLPVWINDLLGRPDVRVERLTSDFSRQDPDSGRPAFVALPVVENQFYPSVRLGVFQSSARQWNAAVEERWGGRLTEWFAAIHRFRPLTIDSSCVFYPLLGRYAFCQQPDRPIDTRPFGYGWRVERLEATTNPAE